MQGIEISKKITDLRETDMRKIQGLGKREATSGVLFLQSLFTNPVVNSATVAKQMKYSRAGASKVIERFVELGILRAVNPIATYASVYWYKNYIDIFND